jgi:hypothetical protein
MVTPISTMAEEAPSELLARLDAAKMQAAAELLLGALVGDPLRAIARHLPDADRFRMRLVCRTMRDHAEPS